MCFIMHHAEKIQGEVELKFRAFLTSVVDRLRGQLHAPVALTILQKLHMSRTHRTFPVLH